MLESIQALPWDAPYFEAFKICLGFIASTWLLSVLTREYSWTDRIWSVAPAVYAVYVAFCENFGDMRLNVMAILITLWGIRLTYNFAIKGGYQKGGEDYRWEILKEGMKPWQYQVFNLTFISGYQNILIFLFVAPMHTAWENQATPFGIGDILVTVLFLALLLGETIADTQMWRYQQRKKALIAKGESVDTPFCTEGLYRFSRHPNYFCELGQWWTLTLFSLTATGTWLHWTVIGALLLHMLFEGSVRFTERISLGKYPAYADYQKRVSRLIPWWPKKN